MKYDLMPKNFCCACTPIHFGIRTLTYLGDVGKENSSKCNKNAQKPNLNTHLCHLCLRASIHYYILKINK